MQTIQNAQMYLTQAQIVAAQNAKISFENMYELSVLLETLDDCVNGNYAANAAQNAICLQHVKAKLQSALALL